jgi:hypothetical protein
LGQIIYKQQKQKGSQNRTVTDFKIKRSFVTWDDIFEGNDVNVIFNNFLGTYLRIYYYSFTKNKIQRKPKDNTWITTGIKISCINKRNLYLHCRNSNDTKLKEHYKLYCRILSKVIKSNKELHYDKIILNSKYKTKLPGTLKPKQVIMKARKEYIS